MYIVMHKKSEKIFLKKFQKLFSEKMQDIFKEISLNIKREFHRERLRKNLQFFYAKF